MPVVELAASHRPAALASVWESWNEGLRPRQQMLANRIARAARKCQLDSILLLAEADQLRRAVLTVCRSLAWAWLNVRSRVCLLLAPACSFCGVGTSSASSRDSGWSGLLRLPTDTSPRVELA